MKQKERPNYMYCHHCGKPLQFLYARETWQVRHYPIWVGCDVCNVVYFVGQYSPLSKTGRTIRQDKEISFNKFKEMLSYAWLPEEPELNFGPNTPKKKRKKNKI